MIVVGVVVQGDVRNAGSRAVEGEDVLLLIEVVAAVEDEVAVVGAVVPVKAVRGLAVGIVGSGSTGLFGSGALVVNVDALAVDGLDAAVVLLRLGRVLLALSIGLCGLSLYARLLDIILNGLYRCLIVAGLRRLRRGLRFLLGVWYRLVGVRLHDDGGGSGVSGCLDVIAVQESECERARADHCCQSERRDGEEDIGLSCFRLGDGSCFFGASAVVSSVHVHVGVFHFHYLRYKKYLDFCFDPPLL